MEQQQTVESIYVAVENGEYVTKKETLSLKPEAGQVLVKIGFSTCDPYDGICSQMFKNEGMRLGGEGSGTIVAIGEGVSETLLNKKISFHVQGTWAQYRYLDAKNAHFIVLHDSQDLKLAAASWINPLTAIGQLDIIEERGSKCYVADAAASALNKMLIRLARTKGIESINIVRKQEQADLLKKEFGVQHVFLQDSPTFEQDYKALAAELKPKVFFDVVGGGAPTTVPVFESLQPGGVMTILACLTGKPIPVNTYDVLFHDKTVNAYLVFPWVHKISAQHREESFKFVADDLALHGGQIFGTKFTKEVPLENWKEALEQYGEIASKEGGKIIIRCNP